VVELNILAAIPILVVRSLESLVAYMARSLSWLMEIAVDGKCFANRQAVPLALCNKHLPGHLNCASKEVHLRHRFVSSLAAIDG
jgi:hypothetical protein